MSRTFAIVIAILVTSSIGSSTGASQQDQQAVPKIIRKPLGALQASATKRVQPEYPPLAKAAHVTGTVVVEVTIDESGNVIAAKALSGHALLKDSAARAALLWKFPPATLSGVPVKVIGAITIKFELGPESGADPIVAAQKEVRDHPGSAQAYYKLALAYHQDERLTEAIQALKDAVRIDPEFAVAYLTLGDYLLGTDRNAEAVDTLKEALRIDPHHVKARLDLGIAWTKLGRYEDAVASYKLAIKDDPSAPAPYSCMAMTFTLMERYEEAADAFAQAIKRQSDDGGPVLYYDYLYLAHVYAQLNRTTEEISALKEAIALRPRIADAHFELGMTYLKMGDKKSATDEYNLLTKLGPEMANSLQKEITKLPSR